MATDLELQYLISADSSKLSAGMSAAEKTVDSSNAHMAASAKAMEESTAASTSGIAAAFAKMATGVMGSNASIAASSETAAATMQGGFKNAMTGMQGSMSGISGVFSAVKNNLVLLGGVLAGGAAFKEAIDSTNKWNGEAMKLSKQLGISTQEATGYMVALHKMGVETDTLGNAVQKVSMQLMKGGQGFETLGIKTKEASGQFRPAMSIITDTIDKIKEIHNPILQAQAGISAFGKSWSDIRPLMKLTGEALEEAKQKAHLLGLEVSPENAANSKKYKENMAEFNLALKAIAINVGQAVLPAFAQLAGILAEVTTVVVASLRPAFDILGKAFEVIMPIFKSFWSTLVMVAAAIRDSFGAAIHAVFGEDAPKDIDYLAGVVNAFQTFFIGFKVGMLLAFEAIRMGVTYLKDAFIGFANVAERAFHMDWDGVKAAYARGIKTLEDDVAAGMNRMAQIASDGSKEIANIWSGIKPPPKKEVKSKQELDPDLDFTKGGKEETLMKGFQSELAMRKSNFEVAAGLAGRYIEFSKEQEEAFWKDKLKLVTKGSADYKAIEMKIAEDRIAIAKKAFDVELANIKSAESEYKNNTDKKLEYATEYLNKVEVAYGHESTQYVEAQKHIVEIKRQAVEQQKQIDATRAKSIEDQNLAMVAAEEELSKHRQALGIQNNLETLKEDAEFEARRYEIKRQGLVDAMELALADPDKNPVEVEKLHAAIEALEIEHQAKMTTLRHQSSLEQKKDIMSVMQSFQQGMAGAIKSVVTGTATIGGAMKSFMLSMMDAVVGVLANMAAAWATQKLAEMILGKTAAISGVAGNAAIAGSAATASAAAIPFYGWAIAPAAGAEAFAAAMSFGAAIPAAAKGFDIPAGVNPLTQLHEKEMVLPARLAEPIREMADGGSGGRAVELHVHATDAQSVRRLFENNGSILADVLKRQQRNFAL